MRTVAMAVCILGLTPVAAHASEGFLIDPNPERHVIDDLVLGCNAAADEAVRRVTVAGLPLFIPDEAGNRLVVSREEFVQYVRKSCMQEVLALSPFPILISL